MNVILHIGLIKTGSSFLQSRIFSGLKESNNILYLGPTDNLSQYNHLSKSFDTLFISNENMAGHPFKRTEKAYWYDQFKKSIHNIQNVYKNAIVIIGFREPSEMIQSVYKQYLQEGGTMFWKDFHSSQGKDYLSQFYFSEYIELLKKSFPSNRLFIYNYDDLKNNQDTLLNKLSKVIGIELKDSVNIKNTQANTSIALELEPVLIRLNRLNCFLHKTIGLRLALRIGNWKFNPTILCQNVLNKLVKTKGQRDLEELKAKFKEDWNKCIIQFN